MTRLVIVSLAMFLYDPKRVRIPNFEQTSMVMVKKGWSQGCVISPSRPQPATCLPSMYKVIQQFPNHVSGLLRFLMFPSRSWQTGIPKNRCNHSHVFDHQIRRVTPYKAYIKNFFESSRCSRSWWRSASCPRSTAATLRAPRTATSASAKSPPTQSSSTSTSDSASPTRTSSRGTSLVSQQR